MFKPFQWLLAALVLLASGHLYAQFVESDTSGGVRYFLFSAPDKIERYDLSAKNYLPQIDLLQIPGHFAVTSSGAFVSHGNLVYRYPLDGGERELAFTGTNSISGVVSLNGSIVVAEGATLTVIDANNYTQTSSQYVSYQGESYDAINSLNTVYFRSVGVSPSDVQRVVVDSDGVIQLSSDSPYHGDFPTPDGLRVLQDEEFVFDLSGVIYSGTDLKHIASLPGDYNDIGSDGGTIVAATGSMLERYDANLQRQSIYTASEDLDYVDVQSDEVIAYSISETSSSAAVIPLADFSAPSALAPANPETSSIRVSKVEVNPSNGDLYILDNSNSTVFIYDTANEVWKSGLGLSQSPKWMSYSTSHDRLYLAYDSGLISYFDMNTSDGIEHYFTALAQSVLGLLSVGDYVFSADASGAWSRHYSFDQSGHLVNSEEWRHTGSTYLWSPVYERIYHYRDGTSPNDIEWAGLESDTGMLVDEGDSPYHGDYSMRYPFAINPSGEYLVIGGGEVFDAGTLNYVGEIGNQVTDITWSNGELFTLAEITGGLTLQHWDTDFSLVDEGELSGLGEGRLLGFQDSLIFIRKHRGSIKVIVFDPANLPDSDSDGVSDLNDNCIDTYNTNQADADEDGIGNVCDEDSDNDLIPDVVENSYGLDPFNASDALFDLDGDKASNLLEYISDTSLSDSSSTPAHLESFVESFEGADWREPNWIEVSNWMHSREESLEGEHSLKADGNTGNIPAELIFRGIFRGGEFTVNALKREGGSSYGSLKVYLDGSIVGYVNSNSTDWQQLTIDVPAGEHEIRLVYGGYTFNYYDLRMYLDALTYTEADLDADDDGVLDFEDNCVNIPNPDQLDFDGDTSGDSCDLDDDNDGVEDSIEELYDALNPHDPDDLLEDADLDGALNGDELELGFSPDEFDRFLSVQIQDFLRLTDHMRFEISEYSGSSYAETVEWRGNSGNQWVVIREDHFFNFQDTYEMRVDGWYLLEQSAFDKQNGNTHRIEYVDGLLQFPAELTLAHRYSSNSKINWYVDNQLVDTDYAFRTIFFRSAFEEDVLGELREQIEIHVTQYSGLLDNTIFSHTPRSERYAFSIGKNIIEEPERDYSNYLLSFYDRDVTNVVRENNVVIKEDDSSSSIGAGIPLSLMLLLLFRRGRVRPYFAKSL